MGNQDAKPLLPEDANANTNHAVDDVIDNDFYDDNDDDDDDDVDDDGDEVEDDEIDEDDKDTRLIGNARGNSAYDKDFQLPTKERRQEEEEEEEGNVEDKKEGARNQRGEWEPGRQFPALDGMYPVIRVISNLSTTSLREVSTHRSKKCRRKRCVGGSIGGAVSDVGGATTSEATTFLIYSDTSGSASSNNDTKRNPVRPLSKFPSSESSYISASDSASNSAWKQNVNQNRISGQIGEEMSPQESVGRVIGLRPIFVSLFFTLVVGGVVVLLAIFYLKQKNISSNESDERLHDQDYE